MSRPRSLKAVFYAKVSLSVCPAQTMENVVTHIHIQQLTCEYTEITSDIAHVCMYIRMISFRFGPREIRHVHLYLMNDGK